MRNRLKPLTGILGGTLLALIMAGTVAAYVGQVVGTVEVSAPAGAQACNTPITVTASLVDINGNVVDLRDVVWSFESGNVTGDTIVDASTTTNANGITTTQVRFACSPHSVVLAATASNADGTVVVGTAVIAVSGAGLPRTDTAPGSSILIMVLAGFAVLIGSSTILRRIAVDRR